MIDIITSTKDGSCPVLSDTSRISCKLLQHIVQIPLQSFVEEGGDFNTKLNGIYVKNIFR